jgi:hypothetical protein
MRLMHVAAVLGVLGLSAVLGCGGGGHAAVVPAPGMTSANPGAQGAQSATVTFSINIPGRSGAVGQKRKVAYVGAGTQSATFAATAQSLSAPTATNPSPVPTSVGTPVAAATVNCTATCQGTLSGVPVGMVSFTVNLYDQANGTGSVISTGTTSAVITTGANSIKLTFNGVPVTVQLSPAVSQIQVLNQPTSIPVAMTVQDADGNTIMGQARPAAGPPATPTPVPLNTAYTFTTSQMPHVTFPQGTITQAPQMLTLAYDGSFTSGTLVQLYSSNPALNLGAAQTAGTVYIGSGTPPTASPTGSPTAAPSSQPTTVAANTFPVVFVNNSGINGAITVYAYGYDPTDVANNYPVKYLTSATTGALALFPTPAPNGTPVPITGVTLPPSGEIDVPQLCSARMYVSIGNTVLNITGAGGNGVAGPAPWKAGDPNTNAIFDVLEYTWTLTTAKNATLTCPATAMGMDTTSVDEIGIPWSLQLIVPGSLPLGPVGLMPYAGSNIAYQLNALGSPWSSLVQSAGSGRRIMNPSHTIAAPGQVPPPFNFDPNYLASYMSAICTTYTNQDLILGGNDPVSGGQFIPGYARLYGRYSGCGTSAQLLNFYASPNAAGPLPNPPPAAVPNGTFSGIPSTVDALGNAGYFAPQTDPGTHLGRILSVSIDRATIGVGASPSPALTTTQPDCTPADLYGGALTNGGAMPKASVTSDWYAAIAHNFAFIYSVRSSVTGQLVFGSAVYALADDDECSLYAPFLVAPAVQPAPGTKLLVTIEPF